MSSECLNEQTLDNVMGILKFFTTPELRDAFTMFGQTVQVFSNLKSCALEQSLTDVYAFCNSNPQLCQLQKLFENLTANLFVLMGKFTELNVMIKEFPAADSQDLYNQTYLFGSDLGTLLRVLVGFKL